MAETREEEQQQQRLSHCFPTLGSAVICTPDGRCVSLGDSGGGVEGDSDGRCM